MPILLESLIIQNVVRGRSRGRDKSRPQHSRRQRQEYVNGDYSVGRGELMD